MSTQTTERPPKLPKPQPKQLIPLDILNDILDFVEAKIEAGAEPPVMSQGENCILGQYLSEKGIESGSWVFWDFRQRFNVPEIRAKMPENASATEQTLIGTQKNPTLSYLFHGLWTDSWEKGRDRLLKVIGNIDTITEQNTPDLPDGSQSPHLGETGGYAPRMWAECLLHPEKFRGN